MWFPYSFQHLLQYSCNHKLSAPSSPPVKSDFSQTLQNKWQIFLWARFQYLHFKTCSGCADVTEGNPVTVCTRHIFPKLISQCLNTFSCQVLMWGDYGDALEPTEVIYKLCHHISGLGVLKLYVPHPLESSTWPPVILSILNLCCYMGDLMWPVEVNWKALSMHSIF